MKINLRKMTHLAVIGLFAIASVFTFASPVAAEDEDTVAPELAIVYPYDGTTIKKNSTIYIQVDVSDNVGVTQMFYSVNGFKVCSGDGGLTACQWHPSQRGETDITVVALDAAGNSSIQSVNVNVR